VKETGRDLISGNFITFAWRTLWKVTKNPVRTVSDPTEVRTAKPIFIIWRVVILRKMMAVMVRLYISSCWGSQQVR